MIRAAWFACVGPCSFVTSRCHSATTAGAADISAGGGGTACDPTVQRNPAELAKAGYMLGNEVVFDDVAAFNRAMASPLRRELRAHFRAFPPFSGANTHWPTTRTRVGG